MRLGIIGLPSSGKTTVFNALTGSSLPTGALAGAGRVEVHTAVVDVPDERVDALRELIHPRKTTYAKVTYADIGGLGANVAREGLPGPLVNQLQMMDAFLHVVRAFEDPAAPPPAGSVDAGRDLQAMEAEFLLHDLLAVERRLEKLRETHAKGGGDRASLEREIGLFERLHTALSEERALRTLSLSQDEDRQLSGYGLLSRKRMLAVVNYAEGEAPPAIEGAGEGVELLPLQGALEMEIAQLPQSDRAAFRAEYGIGQSGRRRVLRASYQLLHRISFFTVGEDEVRAWTLRQGETALDAASAIHTDLARGFIRAEVIRWDELVNLGGLSEARAEGKLRVAGKDYPVEDGEVVHIRFNV